MKSEKDNVSQLNDGTEGEVQDLPVDENQQNQIKGGTGRHGGLELTNLLTSMATGKAHGPRAEEGLTYKENEMKGKKDNVSQVEAVKEGNVEDLPVDEKQQGQIKGGGTYQIPLDVPQGPR